MSKEEKETKKNNSKKKGESAKSKKNRKVSRLLDVLLVVFILTFLGSAGYLAYYFYTINKSEQGFSDIADLKVDDETIGDQQYFKKNGEVATDEDEDKYVEVDGKYILAKYSEIYKKNKDFIGWISIPDTPIDYPVMQTKEDPEHYLRRDFDGNYSISGTIFIDERANIEDEVSDNIIIYGHHMKSGTMFGSIQKYEDEAYFNKHKYIYFDTIYERGTYEVIAAFKTQIYSDDYDGFVVYNFVDENEEGQMLSYISSCQSLTPYDTRNTAGVGDKLITLSTCSYHVDNGRYVVVAKKID